MKNFFGDFIKLLKHSNPKFNRLYIGIFLGIIGTSIQLFIPKFSQKLVNSFYTGVNKELILLIIFLFIGSAIFNAFSGIILSIFGEDVVKNIRKKIWNKIIFLPVNYFDNNKTGNIVSILTNDTDQIKKLLAVSFPSAVTSLFQLFGAIIIMLFMDWKMTSIILLSIPIFIIIMMPLMYKTKNIGRLKQEEIGKLSGRSNEVLKEIRLVRSSNAESIEINNGNNGIEKLFKIGLKESIYDSIASPVMGTVMMALIVGVLAYGANRVAKGTMTMGTMFAFLMYIFQITLPVSSISRFLIDSSKTSGATSQINKLINENEENEFKGMNLDIIGKSLSMQHVTFSYEKGKKILDNISFIARPNSIISFVGPSGSGKSTIFSLIERFYDPQVGKIKIGNTNINNINLKDWREQIGYVSQNSSVISGSIKDNLLYGLDIAKYDDSDLWHVLNLAYAKNFVKKMDNGLYTNVGENGIKLSGGQKQRIAIARAFLRNPKILLLDEFTASLDSESEENIQNALKKLIKGRTTLMIAHRLSTIINSNEIYFIDDGKVIGKGTHKQLYENLEKYRDYVDIQFKTKGHDLNK